MHLIVDISDHRSRPCLTLLLCECYKHAKQIYLDSVMEG